MTFARQIMLASSSVYICQHLLDFCSVGMIENKQQQSMKTQNTKAIKSRTRMKRNCTSHSNVLPHGAHTDIDFQRRSTKKKISHDVCVMKIRTGYIESKCLAVKSHAIVCHSPSHQLALHSYSHFSLLSLCSRVTWRLQN